MLVEAEYALSQEFSRRGSGAAIVSACPMFLELRGTGGRGGDVMSLRLLAPFVPTDIPPKSLA